MSPGDVVLVHLPDASGQAVKLRPALFLATLPGPYQTILTCGISTQLHSVLTDWDEFMQPSDSDFGSSGLRQTSVIRLSYLNAVRQAQIVRLIGQIAPARFLRLRTRLADHLRPRVINSESQRVYS